MVTYLNIKTTEGVETFDEFETRKEAFKMLKEYKLSSSYYNNAYLSQRCTNDWRSL